jgi:hypothetical protein
MMMSFSRPCSPTLLQIDDPPPKASSIPFNLVMSFRWDGFESRFCVINSAREVVLSENSTRVNLVADHIRTFFLRVEPKFAHIVTWSLSPPWNSTQTC